LRVVHPQTIFELAIGVAGTLGIFVGINVPMKNARSSLLRLSHRCV
jgi:hypothetical protein